MTVYVDIGIGNLVLFRSLGFCAAAHMSEIASDGLIWSLLYSHPPTYHNLLRSRNISFYHHH